MLKRGLTAFLILVFAQLVHGHQVEPCLARLTQVAALEKACKVSQTNGRQCDVPFRELQQQKLACQMAQFTPKDIARAIEHGYESVQGDVNQSPYQARVRRETWENNAMQPNVESFKLAFPEFDSFHSQLLDGFNTKNCPAKFEGRNSRLRYLGHQSIKRYLIRDAETAGDAEDFSVYWFAREKEGTCYPVPETSDVASVVNIPDQFLSRMRQQPSAITVLCESADCTPERDQLALILAEYSNQYRSYRQLLLCSDIDQRNENRRIIKGQPVSKVKLPDYCPHEEVQTAALNAKGLLLELDQGLFLAPELTMLSGKSE